MKDGYMEGIRQCCKKLRLSEGLAERAMSTDGETKQEYLYKILLCEVESRNEQRVRRMLSSAKFPRPHDFSQFRTDEVEFPSGCTIEDLKALKFVDEGKNIIMYGGTGTGKTMLSICVGMELCSHGIAAMFFRTAALINRLSEQKSGGTLTAFLKKLDKAMVIILDEFGYVPYDRTGSQLLFDYLSEIHEHKQVILTTNLEFSRWANVLYDERMASALIGRLTHHCHLILFPGGNNRLRESSLINTYHTMAGAAGKGDSNG